MTLTCGVEAVCDRLHLGPVEVHALVHVGVGVRLVGRPGEHGRRRPLRAALVQQHDECVDALLAAELVDQRVDRHHLGPELESRDGARRHDRRRGLERETDEGDLRVAGLADLVRRQDRVVRAGVEDVRGEVLEDRPTERRAVLATVDGMASGAAVLVAELHSQQLADALVELVVADTADVEAHRVQRLDRRLVMEERRDERARADQIASADGDRVRVGPCAAS